MAKNASVFYKLPIDVMRGKLATKQEDIRYEGQAEGESILSLGIGKKQAVNFEKYIVLTNRNGKNSFYVKSATSVHNSVGSVYNRMVMLLTAVLVDHLYKQYKAGSIEMLSLDQSLAAWGGGKTMKEYMTSFVSRSIRNRSNYIQYLEAGTPGSVAVWDDLCDNPFKSFVTPAQIIAGIKFPSSGREQFLLQQNLRFFAAAMDSTAVKIDVTDTVTGRVRPIYLNVQSATTLADLVGSTQEVVWSVIKDTLAPTEIGSFAIRDKDGIVIMSGKPYKDAAKTQPVLLTDVVFDLTTLYI